MDHGESSDDVDGSEASFKKMDENDNGTSINWGGRGVNWCSIFSILACHPHKNFVKLKADLLLFLQSLPVLLDKHVSRLTLLNCSLATCMLNLLLESVVNYNLLEVSSKDFFLLMSLRIC